MMTARFSTAACRLLATALAAATALGATAAQAALTAGAGRAAFDIPPGTLPIDNFTAERDPLQARVLVLDDDGTRVAIAVVDLTSIGGEAVAEMQASVGRIAGVAPTNVWVVASHTFSSPHMFGGNQPGGRQMTADEIERANRYKAAVEGAVARAATDAAKRMRPARLGFGTGTSGVNVNRNVEGADGWWLGADEAGPSDKSVQVVKVEGSDGRPIAMLLNYAVQSAVMDQTGGENGTKLATADLGGAAVAHVEAMLGGDAVALFAVGAAGDQVPAFTARRNVYDAAGRFHAEDLGAAAYPLVRLQGERLGAAALRAYVPAAAGQDRPVLATGAGAIDVAQQDRPRSLGQIKPSRTYQYQLSGKTQVPYYLMRLGDTVLVGVQVELSAATGLDIKRRSPFAHTLVMTMVNGAAKYLPDADSYKKITYESMNSSYGPGSAEVLADRIVADLKALRARPAR